MYNVQDTIDNALKQKLFRAKLRAKNPDSNITISIKHPSETREYAATQTYKELTKRITDEHNKFQHERKERETKLGSHRR